MEAFVLEELVKTVINKFTEPLAKKIIKISKDEWEKFKIDFEFVFTKYIKKSFEKYSKIKTILYKTEPQYIYDFFVSPTLEKEPDEFVFTDNVDNILNISNFIIIQGTGGIGKSTLLKHLFIDELHKQDLIPIFIELKDINLIEKDYTIIDIVYDRLNNLGSTLKQEYIEYALESGCFLFLLDGYDEIQSNKKDDFFKQLDKLCDKYTENHFIISSRPNTEFVEFQRYTVLKAIPLSKEQSINLISKIKYDKSIKERFISELEDNLYESHKSFASNPLLLNIMLLTFDNYADIPEKLHLFYSNAFETLYLKHDATKAGYKREMLSGLSYDSFRKVFSYFCFMTYTKGMLEFTYEELLELINQIKIPRIEFDASNYIYDLENSLCVIYKDGIKYTFSHRSFQEYFTAVFLKDLSDENMHKYGIHMIKKEVYRACHDSVFEMLYDMVEERFEKNILLPIIIEVEKNIDCDRYTFYFKEIVNYVIFDFIDDKLRLLNCLKGMSPVRFIYEFLSNYYKLSKESKDESKTAEDKLFEYLLNEKDYNYGKEIDVNTIMEDEIMWNVMKKTWIGKRIQGLVDLKQKLIEKQEKNDDILENIINFDMQ